MNLKICNNGIIYLDSTKLWKNNVSKRLNIAFLVSASPAMIEDIPDKSKIEHEISRMSFLYKNTQVPIANFIINKVLENNKEKIIEYFGTANIFYKKENIKLTITKMNKTGIIIKNNQIEKVALLAMNANHPVIYSRDYIGYFFNFSIEGKVIVFKNRDQVEKQTKVTEISKIETKRKEANEKKESSGEKIEVNFSNIPLLAFKSENALNNQFSINISKTILFNITNKEYEIYTE